jgi:hypothetical protein
MKKITLFLPLAFLLFVSPAAAQEEDPSEKYAVSDTLEDFGMFTHDDLLELSLRFDVTHYTRKKPKEEYLNATLTYHISETDSVNKEVRLKSRGEFRNGYCSFPPLLLNFKKTEFAKEDLSKLEKMKVVTHCQSGNVDYLMKEYLIYKLYNVLTDTSFRVRLVRIKYINTYKQTKPISSFAFFIEPADLLAERISAIQTDRTNLGQNNMDPYLMTRMAIFNYMIGNTDWSVPNQHNCKIMISQMPDRSSTGIIVPYDFDYSGLVDATYAIPHESLPIKTVRERLFLGICRSDEEFLRILGEFAEKKQAFYDVINNFPYLDDKEKKNMIGYLSQFFDGIDKRNTVLYDIKKNCKEL